MPSKQSLMKQRRQERRESKHKVLSQTLNTADSSSRQRKTTAHSVCLFSPIFTRLTKLLTLKMKGDYNIGETILFWNPNLSASRCSICIKISHFYLSAALSLDIVLERVKRWFTSCPEKCFILLSTKSQQLSRKMSWNCLTYFAIKKFLWKFKWIGACWEKNRYFLFLQFTNKQMQTDDSIIKVSS